MNGYRVCGSEILFFGRRPSQVAIALGAQAIQTTAKTDVHAFVQMLAKIGYSFAVATIGPYPLSEVPVLPLILGSANDGGTWVGSAKYTLAVEQQSALHALGLVSAMRMVDGNAEEITIARIKLFSMARATGYEVVVRRRFA